MAITFIHRVVAVFAGAAIAASAQLVASRAGSAANASPVAAANSAILRDALSAAGQAAAVRYWTPARMTAALQSAKAPQKTRAKAPAPRVRILVRRLVLRLSPPVQRTSPGTARKEAPAKAALAASAAEIKPKLLLEGSTAGAGVRWTEPGAVADATGKVFFTLDGADYVCSGALVGGAKSDVVVTAAHCVTGGRQADGAVEWATNWLFVPGYSGGRMPFGEYTARRFYVTRDWTGPDGGSEQYDVSFVRIAAATGPGSPGAGTPPPGLPISFAPRQDAGLTAGPTVAAYVLGYPALAPYAGQYPEYCAGPVGVSAGSVDVQCRMTAGDSGGPWLAQSGQLPGSGTVVAVSTYKLSSNLSVLHGAVLGPRARALYAQAAGLQPAQSH
jgi:V8-like Glu-specific endopeptidase